MKTLEYYFKNNILKKANVIFLVFENRNRKLENKLC